MGSFNVAATDRARCIKLHWQHLLLVENLQTRPSGAAAEAERMNAKRHNAQSSAQVRDKVVRTNVYFAATLSDHAQQNLCFIVGNRA